MMKHVAAAGGALMRRSFEDEPSNVQVPGWAWGLVLLNLVIFLPVLLYVSQRPPSHEK